MGRRLTSMSWADVQEEMSLAGSPEKITEFGKQVMDLATKALEGTNIAELINAQFALQRVLAEVKFWEKRERKRQHP